MRRPPVLDLALALALALFAVASTAREPQLVHPAAEILAAVWMALVALRTVAPLPMVVAMSACIVCYAALGAPSTPLWSFVAVLVVAFSVGANLDGGRRLVGLLLLLASGYVIQVETSRHDPLSFADTYLTPLVLVGVPALGGAVLRRARAQAAELVRLSAELTRERERHLRAATLAERNRIARELHDVISHAVSVMVVQAGAAEQQLAPDAPARGPVTAIRQTGKDALAELRRQLGVLRAGDPGDSQPLPGLDQLGELVQCSGATLVHEHLDAVGPGLGLAIYRVVQESLTNARRHAPRSCVSVLLRRERDGIDVVVENDGGVIERVDTEGNGLRGMRERVEMYGGQLEAGPRTGGSGWRVHAWLPNTEVLG